MDEEFVTNIYLNETIHKCLEVLHQDDANRFKKKFRNKRESEKSKFHIARELVLGAYLRSRNFDARYEQKINSQTPDWCIYSNSNIIGIVELMNFHADYKREDNFCRNVLQTEHGFIGFKQPNTVRLYERMQEKFLIYKKLVEENKIFFVIAMFYEFLTDLESQELEECLVSEHGLFNLYPQFSGVISFKEGSGNMFPYSYRFEYWDNQNASERTNL